MLFSELNWFDYVMLAVILLSVIFCYRRGFVASTLTLVCWLVAITGAFKLAEPVGNMFEGSIQSEYIRNIIGFFIVFIILALLGVLVIYLFNHMIDKGALYKTDKIVGGFSGIVVGAFIISALLLVGRYSSMPTRTYWTKSYLIPYFSPFVDIINDVLPSSVQAERDILPEDIDEKAEEGAQVVSKKASEKAQEVSKAAKAKASDAVQDMGNVVEDKTEEASQAVQDAVNN